MPALKNPKHEAFAQGRAKGLSQDEAYVAAGYASNEGNAGRLNRNEQVVARIAELLERVAEKTTTAAAETVEKITGELNEALTMARGQERPDRMVMAAVAKAKLNGLIVDKSESTITHKHEDRLARRKEALNKAKQRSGDDDRTALH